MEIGPIFRAMTRNVVGVGLLVIEIAITLAIVLNCFAMMRANKARIEIPSGLAEEELMIIGSQPYGDAFNDNQFVRQIMNQDLETIRSQPGVIDATPMRPLPLRGGGSSTTRMPQGATEDRLVRCPWYIIDTQGLNTLGLELKEGRAFIPSDIAPVRDPDEPRPDIRRSNVIVTSDLAEALFPGESAVGKIITSRNRQSIDTIVGVVKYMYTPYDGGRSGMETRILFFPGMPGSSSSINYMVRVEPNSYDTHFTGLEQTLSGVNPDRIISARTIEELKGGGVMLNRFVVKAMTAIMVLLLFVTAIGIFGMTSFSVSARTKQIGARRALGATKTDVIRYFLIENALITFIGAAIGLILAWVMNRFLVSNIDIIETIGPGLALTGLAMLWVVGFISTLLPALRAARIPPVVATRSV